jgi:predicted dehydrogenase
MSSPSQEALRVGVVGTGALGRHHVRILAELDGVELVGAHDVDGATLAQVSDDFGVPAFASLGELSDEVEAVVVAVPTVHHESVAVPLLEAGRHVLVEKPITPDLESADRLLAAAGDRVLAVGHVEFYNPAVQALLESDAHPRFVEVQRLSVFTQRSLDIDVVLDLMIHDLQILQALDPSPVVEVRSAGVDVLSERIDIANARVELESGCVANLTASRVSAERVRRLRIFSHEAYYSLDYHDQTVRGFRLDREGLGPAGTRSIGGFELAVERAEPLRCELQAFVRACRGESCSYVSGRQGREALAAALEVVNAAQRKA